MKRRIFEVLLSAAPTAAPPTASARSAAAAVHAGTATALTPASECAVPTASTLDVSVADAVTASRPGIPLADPPALSGAQTRPLGVIALSRTERIPWSLPN